MIPLWFLPYAIATGNTVVLKPSDRVPFSAARLVELIQEQACPMAWSTSSTAASLQWMRCSIIPSCAL